ncbi:RHS repeat-associated core domain-containing protein, partial [Lampropedia aestuarii]
YNRYRYYDPQLGAYINQDPIGLAGGKLNLFTYPDNPNQWSDPFGLWAFLAGLLSFIGIGETAAGIEDGANKGLQGRNKIERGNDIEMELFNCVMTPNTCNLSAEELMNAEQKVRDLKKDGINDISEAAFKLGTTVPGTSVTGAIPTSKGDWVGIGAEAVIDSLKGKKK